MRKPIALNLIDEWEGIVNNVERHNARCRFEYIRKQNKLHQMINKALCFAMIAALALILNTAELLITWVAVAISLPCLCAACFISGRFWEKLR